MVNLEELRAQIKFEKAKLFRLQSKRNDLCYLLANARREITKQEDKLLRLSELPRKIFDGDQLGG